MSSISEENKIIIPKYFIWVLIYLIGSAAAYFFTIIQKENDLDRFKKELDGMFQGNSSISETIYSGDHGQLHDAYIADYMLFGVPSGMKELRTKNFTIAVKPDEENMNPNSQGNIYIQNLKKKWDRLKDIKQYFESDFSSGFELFVLKKEDSHYTFSKYWSGDMAYLVSEKVYHQGYSNKYFSSPGYYTSNFRPSISECYEGAAKYLINENQSIDTKGVSTKFYSFSSSKSRFYQIEQNYPKYTAVFDSIFVQFDKESKSGRLIREDQITTRTSANDALIYDSKSYVWYKSISNGYRIEEIKSMFLRIFLLNTSICFLIISLLIVFIHYRKRIVIKSIF